MSKKTIETLVEDIYQLFQDGRAFNVEDTTVLAQRLATVITDKFKPRIGVQKPDKIRPSNMGQPARKLWYDLQAKPDEFKFSPPMLLNFLYGMISEELMLWLAEQAGHEVTHKQEPVNKWGLRGYMDCKIDGYCVDAKSAFAKNFSKFADRSLKKPEQDPYGYIGQLSYYDQGLKLDDDAVTHAYFFVFNKVGSLCLMPLNTLEQIPVKERIEYLNEAMKKDTPPEEKCYQPVKDGKSGNMKLHTQCTRCPHKWECWDGLRAFAYKPWRFLTEVVVEPTVPEITEREKTNDKS